MTNVARFINGKTYDVCGNCGKIIRTDKPIFGDIHLCDDGSMSREQLINKIADSIRLLHGAR